MKIGMFAWAPELTSSRPSSAGNGAWMTTLFDFLRQNGHQIVWLPNGPLPANTEHHPVEKVDVAIFGWRWEMPQYPERHQMYEDQMNLIYKAYNANVPVLVHDQDHMISDKDEQWLHSIGATIAEPSFYPRLGVETLMFPNPYWNKVYKLDENKSSFLSTYSLVYVGNNYGRWDQAVKYIEPFSNQFPTKLYGNWLEPHPDRQTPEKVRQTFPKVTFGLRIQQEHVIDALAEADSTIHLFKPSYGPTGFVTIRWAEAVAAATVAFIPSEFNMPDKWKEEMGTGIVDDGKQMIQRYSGWFDSDISSLFSAQIRFVNEVMRPEPWLKIIERLYAERTINNG